MQGFDFVSVSIFIIIFLIAILAMLLITRMRLKGKIVVFMIERNKVVAHYVFKPTHNFFKTRDGSEKYHIDTDHVMFIDYPLGLPSVLRTPMPCLLYPRNSVESLNPETLSLSIDRKKKTLTAKEIASATREEVVRNIVASTNDEMKSKIPSWLIPAVLSVLVAILAMLVWGMNDKLDSLITGV